MGLDVSAVTLPRGLLGPRVPGCRPSCAPSVWKGNLEEFEAAGLGSDLGGFICEAEKTQTRSPGTPAASRSSRRCQPSVGSPRALLARTPVPRVSGAVLDVWGQSGGVRESRGESWESGEGAGGQRGKSKKKRAGLRLAPPCQGHRLGGAARFPGLDFPPSGPGSGGPAPSPSQFRAAPRAE
uniref:Uncharacterized protein n=1 Tax=Rangifer tarandus platyrhynchus TaxID=3082113 RepID=A0ACB0FH15_RANTA|nr:unnamed protein product [Rangifer tarandus platyrhynchus]